MAVSRLLACVAASCAIHASIIATASLAGALPHRRGSGELVARLALAEAPAAARRAAAPEPAPPAPPAAAQPSELPPELPGMPARDTGGHDAPPPPAATLARTEPLPRQAGPAPAADGLLPLPDPRYRGAAELTRRPQVLGEVPLQFPESSLSQVDGHVDLAVWINEAGGVDRVSVEAADLPQEFRAAAVRAFSGARFRPGEMDGVPVRSLWQVRVSFEGTAQ